MKRKKKRKKIVDIIHQRKKKKKVLSFYVQNIKEKNYQSETFTQDSKAIYIKTKTTEKTSFYHFSVHIFFLQLYNTPVNTVIG